MNAILNERIDEWMNEQMYNWNNERMENEFKNSFFFKQYT